MAETDGEFRKRLTTAYKKLRADFAQVHTSMIEMELLLSGNPTASESTTRLLKSWQTIWGKRYNTAYQFNYAKHGAALKRMVRTLTADEIEARMTRFIASDERFHASARHSIDVFIATVNQFASETGTARQLDAPAVGDCKHTPRCTSDQEHTRRRNAEMTDQPF